MSTLIRNFAITGVLAGLGITVAAAYGVGPFSRGDDPFSDCRTSTVAGGAGAIGGPFTLINGNGEMVTDKDVITKPSILYFGYTFCPDVCPFDTTRNADAVDVLADMGFDVTPVFISIDPDRDTPQVVDEFAKAVHPNMIGLTGSPEQVKSASKAYRTYYKKNDSGDEYYLVDHSTMSYLVLPEHGFVEFFRRDSSPAQIAKTTACFIEKS
jgi:protein SCO1/2